MREIFPRSGRHSVGGEGGYARGEGVKPGNEPRIVGAPAPVESQVLITERAGERDLADLRRAVEIRRRRLETRQRTRDLAGLMLDPRRLAAVGAAPAAFVDLQQRRIHQPRSDER